MINLDRFAVIFFPGGTGRFSVTKDVKTTVMGDKVEGYYIVVGSSCSVVMKCLDSVIRIYNDIKNQIGESNES